MSGVHHRGFLVTLVERTSKYTLIGKVKRKNAADVTTEIVRLLAPTKERVQTITYDNGREFSAHELINEGLDCQSYFAKPYHLWERGLNHRPRKMLAFKTPHDIFVKSESNGFARIALGS